MEAAKTFDEWVHNVMETEHIPTDARGWLSRAWKASEERFTKNPLPSPRWCPHKECICIAPGELMCCGRLPRPIKHDTDFNTHRFCLSGAADNGGVFDLQVNGSDAWRFGIMFHIIKEDARYGN